MTWQTHEEFLEQRKATDWWLPRLLEWIGDNSIILAYKLRGML